MIIAHGTGVAARGPVEGVENILQFGNCTVKLDVRKYVMMNCHHQNHAILNVVHVSISLNLI